ncbi:hypothetical protein C8R32_10977 [Nitrosospira sp. Nsp5]|uniref:Uncharacterized protein n=1 Tax=Nitrosospira multiformis TaxID=1231 RepID=A0ABY0TID3_9PROT|nr:hypothetical protein C8R32_10977 [Nitrosospira sp. Nsp5]SDQ88404.1 hypothetical protein SAMN05216402_2676 [Nitrosospira multiformis]
MNPNLVLIRHDLEDVTAYMLNMCGEPKFLLRRCTDCRFTHLILGLLRACLALRIQKTLKSFFKQIFSCKQPWPRRPMLRLECLDLVRVLQCQANFIQAIQQTMFAERIDIEEERFAAGRSH